MSVTYLAGFFRVYESGNEIATFKSLETLLDYIEVNKWIIQSQKK